MPQLDPTIWLQTESGPLIQRAARAINPRLTTSPGDDGHVWVNYPGARLDVQIIGERSQPDPHHVLIVISCEIPGQPEQSAVMYETRYIAMTGPYNNDGITHAIEVTIDKIIRHLTEAGVL